MKAIVYEEYGAPEVLHLKEMETPVPVDSEILIRVHAASVNYGDLLGRNFKNTPRNQFNMPGILWIPARLDFGWNTPKKQILGSEFSGEVESVGSEVTRFKPGDQVFGYRGQKMGTYAEYLTVPADGMVEKKPANMNYSEAAVLPYGAITAYSLLQKVEIQPGTNVLINGASGGIGAAAVQLAKHYGAEVTGVCGTPRLDFVRSLGADHVIDYTREDFTQNGVTYDVIFDVLGKSSFARGKSSLHENGRYLYASFKMKQLVQMLRTSIISSKKVICALSTEKPEVLTAVKELAESGALRSIIDKTFSMDRAADAHRYVEEGRKQGQIAISIEAGSWH